MVLECADRYLHRAHVGTQTMNEKGFQVTLENLPDAHFYPTGVKPGMAAVSIRYPKGSWTTAEYSSVKAMNRL